MDDEAELQAKIAALAGQINRRKQHPPSQNSAHYGAPRHLPQHNQGASRWAPYGARGGFPPHKNRVLVVAGKQNGPPPDPVANEPAQTATPPPPPPDAFVRARRAGVHQMMTKEAFERERKTKIDNQAKQLAAKQAQAQARQGHIQAAAANKEPAREIAIEGIRFQVLNDGSKLIRISDASTSSMDTPKKATIAGVDFLRTKHGNLVRANNSRDTQRHNKLAKKPQCENFTKHGNCAFGPACRFTHDPTKIAVCKDFLRNGSCTSGRNCDLSHELTYHRVPACTHFLRGNCTNSACRYPHVNTLSTARVCRPFGTLGFCPKGPNCDRRHVFECPDYSNHGRCDEREKGSCSLPHIDRAGNLRKAAKREAKTGFEDESDMSSDEEEEASDQNMDDIDSDVVEDGIVMGATDESHALSQQQDFVAFT